MLMLGAITLAATTLRGCGGINTDCLLSDGGVGEHERRSAADALQSGLSLRHA